jgi:F-type H+-transporting ATPase subunit b
MESTLQALVDLLIRAVPTVLFFVFLAYYLNVVLFKPLGRILEERKKATEGVRELARRAHENADKKSAEFEHALAEARAQLHQENEALRRRWTQEQAEAIAAVRAETQAMIEEARRTIAQEVERAQSELDASIESLSDQVVSSLLERRAA